jgi:hypothetical protein
VALAERAEQAALGGLEELVASAAQAERVELVVLGPAAVLAERQANYQELLGDEALRALHLFKTPVSISSSSRQPATRLPAGLSLAASVQPA